MENQFVYSRRPANREETARFELANINARRETQGLPPWSALPSGSTSGSRPRNRPAPKNILDTSSHDALGLARAFEMQRQLLASNPNAPILVPGFAQAELQRRLEQQREQRKEIRLVPLEAMAHEPLDDPPHPSSIPSIAPPSVTPVNMPTERATNFFGRFKALLPCLVPPFLARSLRTDGGHQQSPPPSESLRPCEKHSVVRTVLCISHDRYDTVEVSNCDCEHWAVSLVEAGFFPSAPTNASIAFSMDLLDFYYKLYEESSDATTAMAAALHHFLEDRGFPFVNSKGQPTDDPIRRSLGNAMLWYDLLKLEAGDHVERQLQVARDLIASDAGGSGLTPQIAGVTPEPMLHGGGNGPFASTPTLPSPAQPPSIPLHHSPPASASPPPNQAGALPRPTTAREECDRMLQDRCPACFGGVLFGRPLSEGGDISVAVDANFMQRHAKSSGETPDFYNPRFFISKDQVDTMGRHIDKARKRAPRDDYTPKVSSDSVDACEKTFDAANERVEKTRTKKYDDTGVVALVCRHDVPLFLCNVDTPGEQQKYAFALVDHLFSLIPPQATVTVLYDIGCVVDRSNRRYNILSPSITERLQWATSAMHSYGHEWPCQLCYNPRLMDGMGLTDGEGVERLWSRLRGLIPTTRTSGRRKRIYLLDRRAQSIVNTKLTGLGSWIRRRLVVIRNNTSVAVKEIYNSGLSSEDLQAEWQLQRDAQKSARAHAPGRLKKQLQSVIKLQEAIEHVDDQIRDTRTTVTTTSSSIAVDSLKHLIVTQETMVSTAEQLYQSLNVTGEFPSLEGMSFLFVNKLLAARDLKLVIKDRVVGRFFEISRLDQSVGGADAALGTRLHQASRQNISKRTSTTLSAIKKFNEYCLSLSKMPEASLGICLPRCLPLTMDLLKDDPYLYEEVWIEPTPGGAPRWLTDQEVRRGIRANLRQARCEEEKEHLGREAMNLARWLSRQLNVVAVALHQAETQGLPHRILLRRRWDKLLALRFTWSNPFISAETWESYVEGAKALANRLNRDANPPQPPDGSPHTLVSEPPISAQRSRKAVQTASLGMPSEPETHPEDDDGTRSSDLSPPDANVMPNDSTTLLLVANALDEAECQLFDNAMPTETVEDEVANALAEIGLDGDSDSDMDSAQVTEGSSSLGITITGTRAASKQSIGDGEIIMIGYEPPCDKRHPIHFDVLPKVLPSSGVILDTFTDLKFPDDPPSITACYTAGPPGFARIDIPPSSLQRLLGQRSQLDDLALNHCAAALSYYLSEGNCMVLTTYFIQNHHEGQQITEIWKNLEPLRTQSLMTARPNSIDRGRWIIPIHQREARHWTIICFDFDKKRITHFDSLASRTTRESDVAVSLSMLSDILGYATRTSQAADTLWGDWSMVFLPDQAVQTNGFDCGVWVLAQLTALLRGFDGVRIPEDAIPKFRFFISYLLHDMALNSLI